MSSYHNKFIYKGVSNQDKNLIITSFAPDAENTDSFLGMDAIYTDKYDGSTRYDYGAKYNSVAKFSITLIKADYSDFTVDQFRDVARWLTGSKLTSWLDLYRRNANGTDQLSYSFLCRCIDLEHYKMDSRTIGIIATFESIAPWAYSPVQTDTISIKSQGTSVTIQNNSDELYSYIYPQIVFQNSTGNSLSILNQQTSETTQILNLAANETVTMTSNQILLSDVPNKIFGDDFNFVWLKFIPGENNLVMKGDGTITLSYRCPIKIGDCAM